MTFFQGNALVDPGAVVVLELHRKMCRKTSYCGSSIKGGFSVDAHIYSYCKIWTVNMRKLLKVLMRKYVIAARSALDLFTNCPRARPRRSEEVPDEI